MQKEGLDILEGDRDQVANCSSEDEINTEYGNHKIKGKKIGIQQYVEDKDVQNSPSNNLQLKSSSKIINGSMNLFKQGSNSYISDNNSNSNGYTPDNQEEQKQNDNSNQGRERSVSQSDSYINTDAEESDEEDDKYDEIHQKHELFQTYGSFKKLEEPLTHQEHLEKYTEKFNLGSDFQELMQAMEKVVIQVQKIIKKSYKYEDIETLEDDINEIFTETLMESETVALFHNTKTQQLTKVPQSQAGRYVISYCPLDVQKLEDVQFNCGFKFLVMKKVSSSYKPATKTDFFQQGDKIDCAGFCLYSKFTCLVYHAGFRVNTYILNKEKQIMELKYHNIKTPKRKGLMSFNSSLIDLFDKNLRIFIQRKIDPMKNQLHQYYLRHTGSVISDFYRTLIYGGLFMIPEIDDKDNAGGINIFDAFIFSYLVEKAWERSSCGADGSVLYKKPVSLDQRVSLYIGCGIEVQELENIYLEIRRQKSVFEALQAKRSLQSNAGEETIVQQQ